MEVKALQQAVKQVARVANGQHDMTLLNHILVSGAGEDSEGVGELTLIATDLETWVMVELEHDGEDLNECLINPKGLTATLKPMKGEVTLEPLVDGVKIGSISLINQGGLEDYPEMPVLENAKYITTFDGDTFKAMVKRALNYVLKTENTTRLSLTGICMETAHEGKFQANPVVYLQSTNGYMAERDTVKSLVKNPCRVLIPAKSLNSVMNGMNKGDNVRVCTGKTDNGRNFAEFSFGNTVYMVQLIDEEFPDLERVLRDCQDKKAIASCEVDPGKLLDLVQQAMPMIPDDTGAMVLGLSKNTLSITAHCLSRSFEGEIEVKGKGTFTDHYKAKFFVRLLKDLKMDSIKLRFTGEKHAMTVTATTTTEDKAGADITIALMPIKHDT